MINLRPVRVTETLSKGAKLGGGQILTMEISVGLPTKGALCYRCSSANLIALPSLHLRVIRALQNGIWNMPWLALLKSCHNADCVRAMITSSLPMPLWRSKKRTHRIATSTTEAELFTMSFAAKHMLWLQIALFELPLGQSQSQSQSQSVLYGGNNQGMISLIRNQKINDHTKQLAVHHLRNLVEEQKCRDLAYVPTIDNLADICTKGIAKVQFERLSELVMQGCLLSWC